MDVVESFIEMSDEDLEYVAEEDLEVVDAAHAYIDEMSERFIAEAHDLEDVETLDEAVSVMRRRIRTRIGKGGRKVRRRETISGKRLSGMRRIKMLKKNFKGRMFNKKLDKEGNVVAKTSAEKQENLRRKSGGAMRKARQRSGLAKSRARISKKMAKSYSRSTGPRMEELEKLDTIVQELRDISSSINDSINESEFDLVESMSAHLIAGFENVCDTAFEIACRIDEDLKLSEWEEGDLRLEAGEFFENIAKDASAILEAIETGEVDMDDAVEDLTTIAADLERGIDELRSIG